MKRKYDAMKKEFEKLKRASGVGKATGDVNSHKDGGEQDLEDGFESEEEHTPGYQSPVPCSCYITQVKSPNDEVPSFSQKVLSR